ncbi:MAG: 4-hydroxy-2-oxovalerate aldolase [Halobacteria archaeon]
MKSVTILDTTLRDGSYAIDFQFTAKDTAIIASALESAGLDMIEVGHGVGLNASNAGKGVAAATDEEYMKAASSVLKRAKWGMFFIPGIGRKEDLELAMDHGMGFVRIGTNITEIEEAEEYIQYAKRLGMFVSSNLMKSYALPPDEFAKRAKLAEEYGADIVYLVDSAGSMFPDDVEKYLSAAKAYINIPIGIHCHENLSLGIANTLKAIECGADMVDSSLQGMGRDAGNPSTEVLVTVLKKKGIDLKIDTNRLMDIGEGMIKPLIHRQGFDPISITSGYAGFHSSYLNTILKCADRYQVDARELIVEVCKQDRVNAPPTLVEEIAKRLSKVRKSYSMSAVNLEQFQFAYQEITQNGPLKNAAQKIAAEMKASAKKSSKRSVINIVISIKPQKQASISRFIQESFSFVIGTVEVNNPEQLCEIIEAVDGTVDVILVDAEMKLGHDISLVGLARTIAKKSMVLSYKDNDVWVSSIDNLIAEILGDLVGIVVAIYGINNLCSKLAIRLAERGCRVILSGASEKELKEHVAALNRLIIREAPYPVEFIEDTKVASKDADVLVGLTPQLALIDKEEVLSMNPKGLIIDGGIGSVSPDAIRLGNDIGAKVIRVDMRAALSGEIWSVLGTKDMVSKIMGKGEISGVPVVAGGVLGNKGDMVLDSISHPMKVVGVADGCGGVIYDVPEELKSVIELVEREIVRRQILLSD